MGMRLRGVLLVLTITAALSADVEACPVCFQGVDSPMLDAARLGVLAMAAVVTGVLGVLGAWFVRLARLESQHKD